MLSNQMVIEPFGIICEPDYDMDVMLMKNAMWKSYVSIQTVMIVTMLIGAYIMVEVI